MASKKTITVDNLTALGVDRLAAILVELADDDADVKRHLRLELAAQMGGDTIAAEIAAVTHINQHRLTRRFQTEGPAMTSRVPFHSFSSSIGMGAIHCRLRRAPPRGGDAYGFRDGCEIHGMDRRRDPVDARAARGAVAVVLRQHIPCVWRPGCMARLACLTKALIRGMLRKSRFRPEAAVRPLAGAQCAWNCRRCGSGILIRLVSSMARAKIARNLS